MSPVPDVDEMARTQAGRDEDDIDTNVITGPREAGREHLGRGGDAREAALVDREIELGRAVARLDFDEDNAAATPCYDVDLAARGAGAAGENAIKAPAQIANGAILAGAPAELGGVTLHLRALIASARA